MDNLYEWLYDAYVLPQMEDIAKGQDALLDQLCEALRLSKTEKRCLEDVAESLRLHWGTEAFAIGVRVGLDLTGPRTRETDASWLSYLFAKLNDPVA